MSQKYGDRLTEIMNKPEFKDKDVNYLCEVTGRGKQYIYKLRNSEIENPDLKTLKQICDEYDVSLDWLLFGEEQHRMYLTDPEIYDKLPEDLKEFVLNDENKQYIVFAKHVKAHGINNITFQDFNFLIDGLRMYYQERNKNKNK